MSRGITYKKRIEVGSVKKNGRTYTGYVDVELYRNEDRFLTLSICGVVRDNGLRVDPYVMGGQCLDEMREMFPSKLMEAIHAVWKRWHLNDMHAGCEHQREFEEEPYEKHAGEKCPICGYEYGTAWCREELPQEIIDQVKSW